MLLRSEGAAIAMRAAERFCPEEKAQMEIHAFAATHIIPEKHLGRVRNYISKNDFVAKVVN